MRKVLPGQRWKPPTAQQHNDWEAAAEYIKRYMATSTGGQERNTKQLPSSVMRVTNNDSTTCPAGGIITIGSATPGWANIKGTAPYAFYDNLGFGGSQPNNGGSPTRPGSWGVALEPIPEDETGLVVWDGLAIAKLNALPDERQYGEIAGATENYTNSWVLYPQHYGSSEILGAATVDSVHWGLVRIGQWVSHPLMAKLSSTLAPNGSATANIWLGGTNQDSTAITIHWSWMDATLIPTGAPDNISSGAEVLTWYDRDSNQFELLTAQTAFSPY